jgi:hypothetical protein
MALSMSSSDFRGRENGTGKGPKNEELSRGGLAAAFSGTGTILSPLSLPALGNLLSQRAADSNQNRCSCRRLPSGGGIALVAVALQVQPQTAGAEHQVERYSTSTYLVLVLYGMYRYPPAGAWIKIKITDKYSFVNLLTNLL